MRVVDEQRVVLRYFGLVVAVGLIATVLLLVLLYQRYTVDVQAREHLEAFHLRTSMLTAEIFSHVPVLHPRPEMKVVDSSKASAGEEGMDTSRRRRIAMYSIGQALGSIERLQIEHAEETFGGTVERARNRYRRIRKSITDQGTTDGLKEELAVFELTMFQLQRLHSGATEEELEDLTVSAARRTRRLILLMAAVLLVSAALMWRLLSLVRDRMRQHAETREALRERDRQLMQMEKVEALGTLVGGVTHDFNNLLTVILGNAEILLGGLAESDPRRPPLRAVQTAAERAASVTRQLLLFSRQDVAESRVVDLNLVIRDVEPLLRRLIPSDISLIVDTEEEPCPVEVDYVQMEQVLINLARNAADAMPQGGTLTIQCSEMEIEAGPSADGLPAGTYTRIRVRDTGHGMRPEVRERAFDPFFTTKKHGKGTGLGLSTVHGIVTKSRGFIFVQSESGRGATFDVYLPSSSGVAAGTEQPLPVADTYTGRETVLLVEDEAELREFTARGLRSAGYRVIEAANGADALHICETRETPIDLLLSDVVMPKMRGPEFVERARELLPGVAVVFMTGYSEEHVLKEVRESGHPLVAKPFKLQHLLQLVRQELDAPEQRAQRLA